MPEILKAMNTVLNNLGQHYNLKKRHLVIIAIGALLILDIIILIFLPIKLPSKNQALLKPTSVPLGRDNASGFKYSLARSRTYQTPDYSISLPSDWISEKKALANGGEFTTFWPASITGIKEYYPSVVIVVEPVTNVSSIASKVALYEKFGMKKTITSIRNIQVTKVSGTFPIKIVNGQSTREPVQKTLQFIETPQTIYTLKYYYDKKQANSQYENFFQEVFSTFRFQ